MLPSLGGTSGRILGDLWNIKEQSSREDTNSRDETEHPASMEPTVDTASPSVSSSGCHQSSKVHLGLADQLG